MMAQSLHAPSLKGPSRPQKLLCSHRPYEKVTKISLDLCWLIHSGTEAVKYLKIYVKSTFGGVFGPLEVLGPLGVVPVAFGLLGITPDGHCSLRSRVPPVGRLCCGCPSVV